MDALLRMRRRGGGRGGKVKGKVWLNRTGRWKFHATIDHGTLWDDKVNNGIGEGSDGDKNENK